MSFPIAGIVPFDDTPINLRHVEVGNGIRFNYSSLSADLAADAQAAASRILDRLHKSIVDTGADLIAIKDRMKHGDFGAWIKAELRISERTAENYMNAARFLPGKNETISDLPPGIIYKLASPTAPQAVVNEVLAAADAGAVLEPQKIKEKLTAATKAECAAKLEAKKSPEQIKREKRARTSRQERDERWAAEQQQEKEKEEGEERARVDRLMPLVQRIADAVGPDDFVALVKAMNDWREKETVLKLLTSLPAGGQS
jgi:DUF3102 family protein